MTTQLTFTNEDRKALQYERYHHPHPTVQRRAETLWLKSLNLRHDEIARIANVSPNTMRNYFELYQEGGVEKLKELNYYHPKSVMQTHIVSLEKHFQEHPPSTIKQAQSEIEELTGIKRSETQVRMFIKKKLGCAFGKSGWYPLKPTLKNKQTT